MSDVKVAELDALMQKMLEQKAKIKAHEEAGTELSKELIQMENRATQYLKDLGREEYDSPFGKGSIKEKWSVGLPVNDIEKAKFFDHLRERGIFDKYATVMSASLNSLYRADWEAAKMEGKGMEFTMPGIGAPKLFEKFEFKAKRGK